MRKELLVLFANRASRFLIIVPPLLQIVLFGWAATMEVRNVEAGFVNHDSGLWSRELLHRMEGSRTFRSVRDLSGEAQIRAALDNQDVLFVMVFNEEFSRNIERGQPAEVQLLMDGRRSNAAQIAASYVNEIAQSLGRQTPGGQKSAGTVNPEVRCWFNPNLEFQWFFLPNLIGMLSLMIGLIVTGLSVAREREGGTFDQLLVSPATPFEIALGKLVPGCLIGVAHGTIFLLIAVFGFGIPFNGSVAQLYLAMLVFSFAAGGVGLGISSISSSQQQAFLGAFAIGVPCILISGAVTPILNMPEPLQHASQLNPLRHFITICLGLFLKGISPQAYYLNLLKIALISAACVIIAIWMFTRRS